MLWGLHGAHLVFLLGHTLGHLGMHWGVLRVQWGPLRAALDIWCPRETPSQAEGSQVPRLRTKTSLLELARWSRRSQRSRQNSPRTTVQDLPSTRAGDQDDVSFKQTPSNYVFI